MLILNHGSVESKAKKEFMRLFPNNMKAHIANIFLEVVRSGVKNPDELLFNVATKAVIKLQTAQRYDDWHNIAKYKILLRNLEECQGEARNFALYCLSWESLPQEMRKADKEKRAGRYRDKWMEQQPATDKQKAYLKKLGWTGCVVSKAHASKLIDRLTGGGHV